MIRFVYQTVILVTAASALHAENWPQFRGPGQQGHSTETKVPLQWSATEHVIWKTPITGESWSSPIVWNDRVFVTTATDGGQNCRVLSLDAKAGKILWDTLAFHDARHD